MRQESLNSNRIKLGEDDFGVSLIVEIQRKCDLEVSD
jgi:hypothetical protein